MKHVNRPCVQPGCPGIAIQGSSRCAAHTVPVFDNRPSPSAQGYDWSWQKVRRKFLSKNQVCQNCGQWANEVHHIVPLRNGGTNDEENLMALCKGCHSHITAKRDGGYGNLRHG